MEPIVQHLKEITETLLKKINIEALGIDVKLEEKNIIRIDIKTDNSSLFIGKHGETLSSFQHILKSLIWKMNEENKYFIIVDTDGYKKRQEENVLKLAERKAYQVVETGQAKILPPMSAYLRKLIHLYLLNSKEYNKKIQTESVGEEPDRRIKISMKTQESM